MPPPDLPVALLILRAGLGVFLLFWSIDESVAPEQTEKIALPVLLLDRTASELRRCRGSHRRGPEPALLAGLWKTWHYATALALHTISTLQTWKRLAAPPCWPAS